MSLTNKLSGQNVQDVLTTAGLACIAIAILRPLALRYNILLDVPFGRKQHHAPIPCIGGIGIVAALLAGLALGTATVFHSQPGFFMGLLGIFVLGIADDRHDLSPKMKLLLEVPLILIALWSFPSFLFFEETLSLPILISKASGLGCATFLLLGFLNALNMTDGIDGLAGFISLFHAAMCAGLAISFGQSDIAAVALGLVGALIGFLLFNFRTPFGLKALVFLGDAGSMVLGFTLAWLSLSLTQHGLPEGLVLWLMSYPTFDSVSTALRRMMKGKNPMEGDRTHLHHLLPGIGLSSVTTVMVIGVISASLTAFGFWLWHCQASNLSLIGAWFLAGAIYVVTTIFLEAKVTE